MRRASIRPGVHRNTARLARYAIFGALLSVAGIGALAKGGHTAPLSSVPLSKQVVLHGGTAAMKQTTRGNQVRWNRAQTTVHLDASIDQLGSNARDAVRNAFGTWLESDARLPSLKFDASQGVQAALKPDGKNSVLVAPITVPGHEHDLAITLTYSDEVTGSVIEADIVINANYAYRAIDRNDERDQDDDDDDDGHDRDKQSSSDSDRSSCVASSNACSEEIYDIQNVVTHEVGHFFGLGEDMDDTSATMYVCTNRCEVHKRVLNDADKAVMTALYADAEFSATDSDPEPQAGCGGARVATRGNLAEAGLALFVGLCLLGRRRR